MNFNFMFLTTIVAVLVLSPFSFCFSHGKKDSPLLLRSKRGAAYAGAHSASGAPKLSTFAALGTYGGFDRNGHRPNQLTISNALGTYGGYLGHKGPIEISSGGYGHGGSLFNKQW